MNSQTINDRRRKWKPGAEDVHPDARMQEIVMMLRAGVKYNDIAKQFGITIQRISAIRKSAGIPARHAFKEGTKTA